MCSHTPPTTTTNTTPTQGADARWRDNTFGIECAIKYNYEHERFVWPFECPHLLGLGSAAVIHTQRSCYWVFNSRAEIFACQSRKRPALFIQGHSTLNRQLGSITCTCFLFDIRHLTLKYTPCNTLQKKRTKSVGQHRIWFHPCRLTGWDQITIIYAPFIKSRRFEWSLMCFFKKKPNCD